MSRSLPFFLLGLLCLACTGSTVYHKFHALPREGWERRDTICFDIPEAEADFDGMLAVELRTTRHVGYRDVVLSVERSFTEPAAYQCDTICYPLEDEEGFSLSGGVNRHQYATLRIPFHASEGQHCQVRIRHLMRHETLAGITEVGIRVGDADEAEDVRASLSRQSLVRRWWDHRR